MNWVRKILILSIVFSTGIGPALGSQFDPDGLQVDVSPENIRLRPLRKNVENSVVIPLSNPDLLREQSPNKINQIIASEMKKIAGATRAGVTHSTVRLLPESAMFFVAMGSVVAVEAFRDHAQNPVAFKQFLEHQLSPVGAFSFWTFMVSQGVTSNLLSLYLKNPKFQTMIPYLGMSVGFATQSLVSEIISDPNVWACSKIMMGLQKKKESGASQDPCAAAHEHFILSKKLVQYAPGFASMLLASVGAAQAQKVIVKGATKITGVDVGLWFIPGAVEVKGLKLVLVNGLRIGLFVHIQALIDRSVTLGWKNMVDSRLMIDSTYDVSRELNHLKKTNWIGSDQSLKMAMKDLHEKTQAWRMANLVEVYEAHGNWLEAIGQLTSMYSSSYAYYNAFINEVRKSRFNESPLKLLERSSPFVGVTGAGVTGKYADLYFTSPQTVEQFQLQTIDQVIATAEKDLNGPEGRGLTEPDKNEVRDILKLFKSEDLWQITKGFEALRKATSQAYQVWQNDRGYIAFLNKIHKTLGNPMPATLPGQGFNTTYLLSPTNFESVKDTSYYRNVGTYTTEKITEYLMMQMICGPDLDSKDGSVIKNRMGFPSVFLPPQIKNSKDVFSFCKSPFETPSNKTIYNAEIKVGNKKYSGFPSYLINEARPSIVGDEKMSNFPIWWEAKTEMQMKKSFGIFQQSYQQIVVRLIEGIFRTDQDRLNLSPFANGAIKSSFQEEKMHLLILQDLFKPMPRIEFDMEHLSTWSPTEPLLKSVDNQIRGLSQLIEDKVKVSDLNGKKIIISTLKNSDLTKQLNLIIEQLAKVSSSLGLKDQSTITPVQLTKAQKQLAQSCIEKLQDLAMEITNYGSMVNAVNWDQLNEAPDTDLQKRFAKKQDETLKKMKSGIRVAN